jgi:hypothetical protein
MKPRGEKKATKTSSTAVQKESILKPVLERAKVVESGPSLEGGKVQSLESVEVPSVAVTVADTESSDAEEELIKSLMETPVVPEEAFDALDSLMGTVSVKDVDGLSGVSADGTYAIGVDYGVGKDETVMVAINVGQCGAPDEIIGTWKTASIGEQPDGSYKAVVTIGEGYWNAIKEWAEADGLTAEQWLSNLVMANVETYGQPAKGR